MKKPNIILFITHDQGQHLSCYNSLQSPNSLKTPNIDSLAENGVKFENHFCTAPQCSPSRGSIITSKYPHQNGLMGLVNWGWTLPESNMTFPMYLKENGYTTHLIGFQHESRDVSTLGYDTVSKRVVNYQYSCTISEDKYYNFFYEHLNDDKPFYVCIGTPEVHRPFLAWGKPVDPKSVKVPPYLPDHELIREDMAEFYGAIHTVDKVIGRVLKCLQLTGLKKNTIFIYTTDHGIHFPRAKCSLYDPGIKTLLIMNWPESTLFSGGKVIKSMISNIDLLPTILDLIDAEIPKSIEGKSFLPILKEETQSIRNNIYAEKSFHEIYDPMRCVRTRNYKYIHNFKNSDTLYQLTKDIPASKILKKQVKNPRMEEELYDLEADSLEMNNLINNPEYESIADELRKKLNDWMVRTNDPILNGVIKPPPLWLDNYNKLKVAHDILYFFLLNNLVPRLMKIGFVHKILSKLMRYFP